MRKMLIAGVLVGAVSYPAAASAGCWATVALDPPPPGTAPGDPWPARITVLQHGANPLPDARAARPTVTITSAAGGRRTFTATPTDPSAGVYTARVVFPSAGRWTYRVFDGFTSADGQPVPCGQTHTFAAVEIGGPEVGGGPAEPVAAGRSGVSRWAMAGGFGTLALAAIALAVLVRRGRSRPAAAA
jgi:hypothetical protein